MAAPPWERLFKDYDKDLEKVEQDRKDLRLVPAGQRWRVSSAGEGIVGRHGDVRGR